MPPPWHKTEPRALIVSSCVAQLLDAMEPIMADGGNVVDYHSCDFFPERFFDLVLVMRVDNTTLFDRLTAR